MGFVPGDGRPDRRTRWSKPARWTSCSCWAPTRSRPAVRTPSRSIWAATATGARTAPTSSCRARPIPRSRACTSTPRAGCRWPNAPSSPRARPRKTGPSCAPCRQRVGQTLPYDTLDQLRTKLMARPSDLRPHRLSGRRRRRSTSRAWARRASRPTSASPRPCVDPYLNNPIARASATMAELSRPAHGSGPAGGGVDAWNRISGPRPSAGPSPRRAPCCSSPSAS